MCAIKSLGSLLRDRVWCGHFIGAVVQKLPVAFPPLVAVPESESGTLTADWQEARPQADIYTEDISGSSAAIGAVQHET